MLFSYGFRPFFLLAGLWAVVPTAAIAWVVTAGTWPAEALPLFRWHGHEMLFGFAAAAIAGFLLTAVPNWTSTRPVSGVPLAALVVLWVLGRIASAPVAWLPPVAAGTLAAAFFPALALTLAVPLVRSRNLRNLPFLVFLGLLFVAELLFQTTRFGGLSAPAFDPLRLAVDTIALMVAIVGGRIVPAFTRNTFKSLGRAGHVASRPWIDAAAIATVAAVVVAGLVAPNGLVSGGLAALAAVLLAIRLGGWAGHRTLDIPLLWVLHLGYAWLVVGFALKAAWILGGFGIATSWLHAFTAGAFGTMILGVTTRAALGHTGRALVASKPIVAAYVLVTAAAVLRVGGPVVLTGLYVPILVASASLWTAAFVVFVVVYTPILLGPRADAPPAR